MSTLIDAFFGYSANNTEDRLRRKKKEEAQKKDRQLGIRVKREVTLSKETVRHFVLVVSIGYIFLEVFQID